MFQLLRRNILQRSEPLPDEFPTAVESPALYYKPTFTVFKLQTPSLLKQGRLDGYLKTHFNLTALFLLSIINVVF